MVNPSGRLVATIAVVAFLGLVLGLATDVGPFGWGLAALLGLYLAIVVVTQRARRRAA